LIAVDSGDCSSRSFGDVDVPIEKQVLAFLVAALKPCTEMS